MAGLSKLSRDVSLASLKLESRELQKLEKDLLSFLLIASKIEGEDVNSVLNAIKNFFNGLLPPKRKTHRDLDFEYRTEKLAIALYNCGIPYWVAERNAYAFMCMRPDFDMRGSKYHNIIWLLEKHQDKFLEKYIDIKQEYGLEAADQWLRYIRDNDIFWARIVQLPSDFAAHYLFSN